MSRSRKVEPETAIQAAMALFWKHGYHDLGTRQIEKETGITRFTLQTVYGGKMPLFLKALDRYLDTFEVHAAPTMSDGNLDAIAAWFETRSDPVMFPEVTCYGCLLLNSTVEFVGENEEVNLRADRFFDMVRGGFRGALDAVKETGGVSADFDVDAMVEVLLSAAIGLNIVIRASGRNAAGADMANAIAALVRGWARPADV
ncbi:MAG: TetR/AcrR family transcriptional regulator [Rhodobacteraceae bacterium]|nr:TetR/AcrR family transcriptional regulator [Paracoccaceae bacterium]